jgi:hypothetical protein
VSTYEVISKWDPAIDWAKMPAEKRGAYRANARRSVRELDDYHIPGKRPTVFTMRECPSEQWLTFVKDAGGQQHGPKQQLHALLACLRSARDLPTDDGLVMSTDYPFPRYPESDIAKSEGLERIPGPYIDDLLEVAYWRSFFRGMTGDYFPMPHTSHEPWEAWVSLRAAASPSSPDPNSDGASRPGPAESSTTAGTTTPGPQTSGDISVSPTAATAAGQ